MLLSTKPQFAALSVRERHAAWRAGQTTTSATDAGQRQYDAWRSMPMFRDDEPFLQRISADGLQADTFLSLLKQAPVSDTPLQFDWSEKLSDIFDSYATPTLDTSDALVSNVQSRFVAWLEPLVWQVRHSLASNLTALHSATPIVRQLLPTDSIDTVLLPSFIKQVEQCITPLLVFELRLARLTGELTGDTPEARYQDFIHSLQQASFRTRLINDYPVLVRTVAELGERWVAHISQFAQRLGSDWRDIVAAFEFNGSPMPITGLNDQAGDRHGKGKTVILATFGDELTLVYKPRPQHGAAQFQRLLAQFNEWGLPLALPTLTVLTRESYGWIEFVTFETCQSADDVGHFYERLGSLLGIIYLLGGNDMHYDNVIAHGPFPYIIDLESLFHPLPQTYVSDSAIGRKLAQTFHQSVKWSSMLPQPTVSGNQNSAIGYREGQPVTRHVLVNAGTDEMHFGKRRSVKRRGKNRPILDDQPADPLDYADHLIAGFKQVLQLCIANRAALAAEDGLLHGFADSEIRLILRDTSIYSLILREQRSPKNAGDGLAQSRTLDLLWSEAARKPKLADVIQFEQEDLRFLDVPLFTGRPGCRDLWTSDGTRIPDYLAAPPLDRVLDRLQQLDDALIAQQVWFIRGSLATLYQGVPDVTYAENQGVEAGDVHAAMLAAVRAAGDQLVEQALHVDEQVTWIGVNFSAEKRWQCDGLSADLFDGISGVALFLAHLGAVTGDEAYSRVARQATLTMLNRPEPEMALGTLADSIFTFAHLGTLWQAPELIDKALHLAQNIDLAHAPAGSHALFDGWAGLLIALSSLYVATSAPDIVAVGNALATYLQEQPITDNDRQPASSTILDESSGIALAVATWHQATAAEPMPDWPRATSPTLAASNASLLNGTAAQLAASFTAAHPAWRAHARRLASDVTSGTWRSAAPLGVQTPGLFTGLSGIGLTLLHCLQPEATPCFARFSLPLG